MNIVLKDNVDLGLSGTVFCGSSLTASLRPAGRSGGFAAINAFHVACDATNLSAGFN